MVLCAYGAGDCSFWHDAHRLSLHPLYEGPFWVLEAGAKSFVLDMGGSWERVTLAQAGPGSPSGGGGQPRAKTPDVFFPAVSSGCWGGLGWVLAVWRANEGTSLPQ